MAEQGTTAAMKRFADAMDGGYHDFYIDDLFSYSMLRTILVVIVSFVTLSAWVKASSTAVEQDQREYTSLAQTMCTIECLLLAPWWRPTFPSYSLWAWVHGLLWVPAILLCIGFIVAPPSKQQATGRILSLGFGPVLPALLVVAWAPEGRLLSLARYGGALYMLMLGGLVIASERRYDPLSWHKTVSTVGFLFGLVALVLLVHP